MTGLVLAGCSKDKEGPQGPQGVQGVKGEDGNANVTQFTVLTSIIPDDVNYSATVNIPINNDMVDQSAIFVYVKDTIWNPVPGDQFGSMKIVGGTDSTDIVLSNPSASAMGWVFKGNVFEKVRVVVIEASNLVEINGKVNFPDFDNYQAVREFYGLPE